MKPNTRPLRTLQRPVPRSSLQAGLTLVEMMVGLTIGMLLVAGLALLFGNAGQSNTEIDKSVRQIENGRYAIDVLNQEIGLAGYYGTVPNTTASSVTSPCLNSADLATQMQAMQAAATPTVPFAVRGYTPTDSAALSCLSGLNHKAGTPAIVLRRLETTTTPVASMTNGMLYVQSSHYFADNYTSYKTAVGSGSNATNFNLRAKDGTSNPARRMLVRIYYVASCNECGSDTVPTLKMVELNGAGFTSPAPIAEGIEQIGFDYGIDTNGDGSPDEWYGLNDNAGSAESTYMLQKWGNVTAVRVYLLARNTETTPSWTDTRTYAIGSNGTTAKSTTPGGNYKRRTYITTIRLNSWAGSRES